MSYILKEGKKEEIKKKFKERWLADSIGISYSYASLILSGKKTCPKRIAYCFVKTIDSNSEIAEYFEEV